MNPITRKKAIETSNKLTKQGEYSEKEAIDEAIKKAEEWFYDLEGYN